MMNLEGAALQKRGKSNRSNLASCLCAPKVPMPLPATLRSTVVNPQDIFHFRTTVVARYTSDFQQYNLKQKCPLNQDVRSHAKIDVKPAHDNEGKLSKRASFQAVANK